MLDMRKYSGKSYLKVEDVRTGPLQRRIAAVSIGQFDKPELVFETGDILSLNTTNTKTLIRAYGSDGSAWIGHVVELYLGEIEYQGNAKEAILIRPLSKADVEF
jgi:hypothetical protein